MITLAHETIYFSQALGIVLKGLLGFFAWSLLFLVPAVIIIIGLLIVIKDDVPGPIAFGIVLIMQAIGWAIIL